VDRFVGDAMRYFNDLAWHLSPGGDPSRGTARRAADADSRGRNFKVRFPITSDESLAVSAGGIISNTIDSDGTDIVSSGGSAVGTDRRNLS
jgi:hypothetical protein